MTTGRTDCPHSGAVERPPTKGGGSPAELEQSLAALANVGALVFLAARAVPGGFWLALAGGVPLARAGQRHGTRAGYATAGASLVETVAVMGPARLGIPLPHAASAPLLGALEARGAAYILLAATGALIRYGYYLATTALYIWVFVGIDAYVGAFQAVRGLFPVLPAGKAAALWAAVVGLAVWSGVAGLIQAWIVRRGLRRWPEDVGCAAEAKKPAPAQRMRIDPRAVAAAAAIVIAVALATTDTVVLVLVATWLVAAWVMSGAAVRSVAGGLLLAAPLALSTLAFGVFGGIGAELALRRAARVALLVLIAIWLRAAAGAGGLREVSLRLVRHLRRVRTLALTGLVLATSAGAADYGAATRRLARSLRTTRKRPGPILDALLGWLAEEGQRPAPLGRHSPSLTWSACSSGVVLSAGLLAAVTITALTAG